MLGSVVSGLSLTLSNLQRLHAYGLLYLSKVADDATFAPFVRRGDFHMENLPQLGYAISRMVSSIVVWWLQNVVVMVVQTNQDQHPQSRRSDS
jgi:hypothetical protein